MRTEILYSDKHTNKYTMSGWDNRLKVFKLDFSLEKPLSDPLELLRFTSSLEESDGMFFIAEGRFDYVSMRSFENYTIEERN
ncbi:hypothetical protein [Bacillus cereus]|uniref:hypothetical protein n=1 Tax=Bacillus cereus TaxID=1396 RepID=UPI000BFB11FB|nr:hypothetical protein [Bacillus cereus]PFD41452.1 hypothetical protein CN281_27100 [Bacillus cereus]